MESTSPPHRRLGLEEVVSVSGEGPEEQVAGAGSGWGSGPDRWLDTDRPPVVPRGGFACRYHRLALFTGSTDGGPGYVYVSYF